MAVSVEVIGLGKRVRPYWKRIRPREIDAS